MDGATSSKRLVNDSSGLIPCWSCKGPVAGTDLFCETCHAVQPPGQGDHFARFGIEPDFEVDTDKLEMRYFELQRYLHPDRFANKSAKEKSLSQQQAVSLNEAFEVLKDPLNRADYLLKLKKGEGISHDHTVKDPLLLMEAMETREALMAAEKLSDVEKISDKARRDIRDVTRAIGACFEKDDLDGAMKAALKLKYLKKLFEETRQHKAKLKRALS